MPIVRHQPPARFDLCGESAHRGNWYSKPPSARFCEAIRKHTGWIEHRLDRTCGHGNLALCRGTACLGATGLHGEGFDGHTVNGEFRLGTRSSMDDWSHEWVVVKKAAANGRDLLFDPTAKQFWQDLRGRPERFTRRRYVGSDHPSTQTPFESVGCTLGEDED